MSDEHLTHGWEPDTDPADTILRAFVLSTAEVTAWIAEQVGGRAQRCDDVAATDAQSPVFFDNFAVLLTPPAYTDLDDVITRLTAFYPPERHWVLLSVWPTPDLTGHGLALMGHPPFMTHAAGGAAPPLPAGLRIVEATATARLGHGIVDVEAVATAPDCRGRGFGEGPHLGGDAGRPGAAGGALLQ